MAGSAGLRRAVPRGVFARLRSGLVAGAALLALVTACAAPPDPTAGLWHSGELTIGTGNTTGTFYQVGAGYADLINRYMSGYDATAAATDGSVDNLKRLAIGDIDIGLAFESNAVDAYRGTGTFAGSAVPVRALARLYNSYAQVIVRTAAGINSLADLRGHRISTGAHGSGSETMALHMLKAAGIDAAKDVTALSMSLPQSTDALAAGTIDALFYSAGLPTTGITDLFGKASGRVHFLATDGLLPQLDRLYGGGVYAKAVIPRAAYGQPADVPTIAEPNLLVVSASMPVDLAYHLTEVLFDHQNRLAEIHPEANNIKRDTAGQTDPVPLHEGARRYYAGG
jgi:TRAP transporter TAXI family solute receptor